MKHLYLLFLLCCATFASGQESWDDFSGEERAFFYHFSRKTEILKPELFHLFEFTDSIPYINDTLPDYKYVEKQILRDSTKLILHRDQMSRKSCGLVSDLATRFAIWELDKVLQFRNSTAEMHKPLLPKLKKFEHYVLENIPQTAVSTLSDGSYSLKKGVEGYYSPSQSLSDKMAAIKNSAYVQIDQMLVLNAIMQAMEKYVLIRSKEIYLILGGSGEDYRNYLSAAGDGSDYSSLEGSLTSPYTAILPDEKGLFRFHIEERVNKETDKKYLGVKEIRVEEFMTRRDLSTVIHFDVYGYHPERQTTIAIQKGGSSYILYGKNDHRLVSPDSTYGEGTTYWRLMWELREVHIAELREALYGKRGYEYWIEEYEKRIDKTLLRIKKTEYKLDQLRHKPSPPPKIKKKKIKKKDLGKSDQDGTGHPTGALTKLDKKKNVEQNRLVRLNTLLENQKNTLAKLKKEMEEAYFRLVEYETLLDKMEKNLGYLMMDFEQEGDVYTFADGATFNYATQDFVFPPNGNAEVFHIYHISFGKTVFASAIDENFLHLHLSSFDARDKYVHEKIIRDDGPMSTISKSDSIQIMEFFMALKDKDQEVEIKAVAGGIIGESNGRIFRDSTMSPAPYDEEKKTNNGLLKYRITRAETITMEISCYEDAMIPFGVMDYQKDFVKLKNKYPELNEVDFWTGFRAKSTAYAWIGHLKQLALQWIKDDEWKSIVIQKLDGLKVKKVYFANGRIQAKVPFIMPVSE